MRLGRISRCGRSCGSVPVGGLCWWWVQVDKLDKNAISEVKAYNKPPKAVETVLSAVMTLFGQPTDWANSKKVGRDSHRQAGC